MSKAKTETKMDSFQSWAHRWGRVGTLIALIYMVALPFVVLAAYDSIPSLGEVFNVNTFSILLIYIPVGFSEALSYTPILGCSAYLAFITGNIMNLKLPVAANAMNLTKKQPNTPEGEAIASVAVAVSSLMTVAILTLAAVCASFISPVFELPAVKTASGYLLPALFGSMALGLFASSASGNKVVKGGIKGVLPVLIIMTVLSLAARLAGYGAALGGLVGIFIIVMLPIGILTSYVLWKKGKIQVVDKEQKYRYTKKPPGQRPGGFCLFCVLFGQVQFRHQLVAHDGEHLFQLCAVLRGETLAGALHYGVQVGIADVVVIDILLGGTQVVFAPVGGGLDLFHIAFFHQTADLIRRIGGGDLHHARKLRNGGLAHGHDAFHAEGFHRGQGRFPGGKTLKNVLVKMQLEFGVYVLKCLFQHGSCASESSFSFSIPRFARSAKGNCAFSVKLPLPLCRYARG